MNMKLLGNHVVKVKLLRQMEIFIRRKLLQIL